MFATTGRVDTIFDFLNAVNATSFPSFHRKVGRVPVLARRAVRFPVFAERAVKDRDYPAMNALEKDGEQIITARVPGMKKEDLTIEVKGDLVRISGKRKKDQQEGAKVLLSERSTLQFDRTFKIPYQVDSEQVTAELKNGILSLHLPKTESEKPKTIQVS